MRALIRLLRPDSASLRWMLPAALMALAAVLLAIVLLAVSGWLITASALAGIGMIAALDIFAPGAVIRAAAVGRTVTRYLERLIGHEATFRQLAELRIRAFGRLLALPIERLQALGRGDTLSRLTRDVDVLDHVFPRLILPSAGAFGATLVVVAIVWWVAPESGMTLGASYFGGAMLVLVIGTRLARGPGRKLAAAAPVTRSALAEWLHGVGELISVGRVAERAGLVMRCEDGRIRAQRAQRRIEALMRTGIALCGYLGFWLVLLVSMQMVSEGLMDAPVAAALGLLSLALVDAWLPLAASWSFFETCRQAARRVDELGDAAPPPSGDRAVQRVPDCRLEAENLWYRYPGALDPVLGGIDFRLEVGEHVLVQGASGVGKTTLGKLLAGILEPDIGTVSLGGVALGALDPTLLRGRVGYLSQDPMLFRDSLAANLRLGAPDAGDGDLIWALETVGLAGFADRLPEGLETWIGEHGRSVSGGQGRRIALARMLLADFRVLVLDEPMAGVDAATTATVATRLAAYLDGRSVVVLSHDANTLARFDRRVVLTGTKGMSGQPADTFSS